MPPAGTAQLFFTPYGPPYDRHPFFCKKNQKRDSSTEKSGPLIWAQGKQLRVDQDGGSSRHLPSEELPA